MYLILLFSCLLAVAGVQLRWAWKRRAKHSESWEDLLSRAERVDFENVRQVAECYLNPDKEQFKREPAEMWDLLGGLDGINRLHHNAELMLEVAMFAEQWKHPDAPLIAELIRRDGVRLKRLVTRMQLNLLVRRIHGSLAFDLQEAAATYFLMRNRLVGLYETCHVARVPALSAAF